MDSIKILFSFIGYLLEISFGIIYFYLMRIYFEIEIIGYYGVITSFLSIFTFIINLGLSIPFLKVFSESKNLKEEAIWNGTFLSINIIQFSIYIIIILILFPFYPVYGGDLMAFYIFFLGNIFELLGTYVFSYFLISKKHVIKKSLAMIISLLIKIFLITTLNLFGFSSITILAIIYLTSNFIYFLINLFFLKGIKLKKPNRKFAITFIKFGFPLIIMTCMRTISINIDILLVNVWFSVEIVANYFSAKQIYIYSVVFITSFFNILTSTFSKNLSLGENEKNLIIIKQTHKFLNLFLVPLIFLIALYSTEILVFIFGENYFLTGVLLSVLVFKIFTISIDIANEIQLSSLGKFKFIAIRFICEECLAISLMIIFMSPELLNLGPIGGALAFILAPIIIQIIYRPIIYKKYGLGIYWGAFRNFFIMLLIIILQLVINNYFSYSILFIPIFMLFDITLYFLLNFIVKGFSKEDIKFIFTIINIKNIKDVISLELNN